MAVSVFDLFKIGIGPSSSHTVGPMRAARLFALRLGAEGVAGRTARVQAHLYGSLGATGKGHGSDKAVLLGLAGHEPDTVPVDGIPAMLSDLQQLGIKVAIVSSDSEAAARCRPMLNSSVSASWSIGSTLTTRSPRARYAPRRAALRG